MKQKQSVAIPENYLNLSYYLNKYLKELPEPPLDPETRKPISAEALSRIFPQELIRQEMSLEKEILIPEEIRTLYEMYRVTPMHRALRLEKALKTTAKIFIKYEGVSPVGSHKLNTAVAQAYYNKQEGIKTLVTETGAGQWGTALALACRLFQMHCRVFMVRSSFEQKPYRKIAMEIYGAHVTASPSNKTKVGRSILKKYPTTTGSLGMAISEAMEETLRQKDTHYALGSVLNHVLLHQTVIGLEAKEQLAQEEVYPDVIVACNGGGSNLGGIAFPFLADKLDGSHPNLRVIAVEPSACPSLTQGTYRYDSADSAGFTPLLKMYTMGNEYVPPAIHAGGLRYHGDSPLVSFLYHKKLIEAVAYDQDDVFVAARVFAQTEGIIPAPESAHAIKHTITEALQAKEEGTSPVILCNISGHGLLDMKAYAERSGI